MAVSLFTPKQVALALGVSESSVKRWVDNGKLPAARTAGGHRKVPLPSIAAFVRESGHELSRPEVLGMVAASQRSTLEKARDLLFEALINGRGARCRQLVLGFYQGGETLADLGDRLIGPVFERIGDGWASGEVQVRQERLSCEVMKTTLHELRRWIPSPPADAPEALVATPLIDFSEAPVRLVELVLLSLGWNVTQAGSGLPLEEIRDSVLVKRPRLACLSVTHLEQPEPFVTQYNGSLVDPTREALGDASTPGGVCHVIGGAAVASVSDRLHCDLYATSLADLVLYQATLRDAGV